eukprot:2550231-Amphidinium_carterae.1
MGNSLFDLALGAPDVFGGGNSSGVVSHAAAVLEGDGSSIAAWDAAGVFGCGGSSVLAVDAASGAPGVVALGAASTTFAGLCCLASAAFALLRSLGQGSQRFVRARTAVSATLFSERVEMGDGDAG